MDVHTHHRPLDAYENVIEHLKEIHPYNGGLVKPLLLIL